MGKGQKPSESTRASCTLHISGWYCRYCLMRGYCV